MTINIIPLSIKPGHQKKRTHYISSWITGLKTRQCFKFSVYWWMIIDVINVIVSLPSQHVIFGGISTVLGIAAAWVYSHAAHRLKNIILETKSEKGWNALSIFSKDNKTSFINLSILTNCFSKLDIFDNGRYNMVYPPIRNARFYVVFSRRSPPA